MTPDVRKHGILPEDDRSTDKSHIQAAVAKYLGGPMDRQARWLRSLDRLRKDIRLQTTYQKSLLDRVDDDGRIRASFLMHGTSTGRLSSQNPNLQNIPSLKREDSEKTRPMRRAFRPADGREWVEVDYSQLELRVAAALSGDEALTKVFKDGRDIHQEVAAAIFSKDYAKVTEVERYLSKAVGFGIIYGRGAKALATGVEMRYVEQKLGGKAWTVDQAELFIRKFLRSYPDLATWIEHQHEAVKADGYVESPFGRRRRFPLTPRSRGEMNAIERQAVNTPIQSAASDICLEAMVRIDKGIVEYGIDATILFPVHDSICLEVNSDQLDRIKHLCKVEMEQDFMGVPLTVSFEHGPNWAEVSK